MVEIPRPQDKLAMLRRMSLFASCTERQLQLVAERSRLVEYKKGECIYREGGMADALYVVASGRLQVFTVINNQKHLYTVLHNGDSFGEISLLTGETHSATVEAISDTLVLKVEKPNFDELINRIPSLSVYLSRLLSKRLRTKGHVGITEEATVVAIYSAARGVGRTVFAVSLAAALHRETHCDTVLLDLSTPEGSTNQLLGSSRRLPATPTTRQSLWTEETYVQETEEHPLGFHFLYARDLIIGVEGETVVAPLINGLAKRYRYIVADLPVEIDALVLKTLSQADLVYLVSDEDLTNVTRTKALMHQLREVISYRVEQTKIILNLMESGDQRRTRAEVAQLLGHPVNFLLPYIPTSSGALTMEELARLLESRESPYATAVRWIARELGGLLVGLSLGSGAALGLAHIGVLKVIERENIPVDIVAGSSIGALIAGLWASGRSAEELERMALRFKDPWDIRRLFVLDLGLPAFSLIIGALAGFVMGWLSGIMAGLLFGFMVCVILGVITGPLVGGPIQGAQLMAKLQADFQGKTFEETWLPLKIVATNPMAREEVVFESGPIADAVRASVSIPGIFKPPTYQGKLCLDGGVINPVPVNILKQAGARRIIAVNVFPTTPELQIHLMNVHRRKEASDAQLASRSFPVRLLTRLKQELFHSMSPLIFDVIMRSMQAMEYLIAEVACREADLTIRPTIPGSHWLEFYHPEKFIQRGEEEALRQLPAIKQLVGLTTQPALPADPMSTPEASALHPEQPGPSALTTHPETGTIHP